MNKTKLFIIIGAIVLVALYVFNSTNNNHLLKRDQKDDIQNSDVDSKSSTNKKEISLKDSSSAQSDYKTPKAITTNALWEDFSDYTISVADLIDSKNTSRSELIAYSSQAIFELQNCLTLKTCIEPRDPDHPYYDEFKTKPYELIERSLSILSALSEEQSDIIIKKETLKELIQMKNEGIQSLAIDLLTSTEMTSDEFNELLSMEKSLTDEALENFFPTLAKQTKTDTTKRDLFIEKMKDIYHRDNSKSILLGNKLDLLELSSDELTSIAASACHALENPPSHNKKRVVFQLESYGESRGIDISLKEICN